MKTKTGLLMLAIFIAISNLNAIESTDEELLGLPGDNLDLYATLTLFQESKTIEEFEASLNDEENGINNLDLDLDGDVDFIKVVTQGEGDDFAFVLQVDVLENEIQDVAVVLVTKDESEEVNIQMVGDEELYGKDYVIEPKLETPAVTANPAYSGADTVVIQNEPATVVVVESEPIVQYVYSPIYTPYYSPYYYGYYPPYYTPYPVISVNVYFGRNRYHRNNYYGGNRGGNTVVINNNNTYNNYSRTKNTSNTVNKNRTEGNYKSNNTSKRPASDSEKSSKVSDKKSVPNSKENATKSSAMDNKSSVPADKSKAKPTSKPASKPANKPAAKPASRPSSKPKGNPRKR